MVLGPFQLFSFWQELLGYPAQILLNLMCTSAALDSLPLPIHRGHLHQGLTAQLRLLLNKSFQKLQEEEHVLYSLHTKQAWPCTYVLRGKQEHQLVQDWERSCWSCSRKLFWKKIRALRTKRKERGWQKNNDTVLNFCVVFSINIWRFER